MNRHRCARLVCLIPLLLWLACGGATDPDAASGSAENIAEVEEFDPLAYDKELDEALAEGKVEARAFFEKGAVWCELMSVPDLQAWVERVYAAGAEEVVFTGMAELGGRQVSAWLVIRLPEAADKRARVWKVYREVMGDEAPPDKGQRYLDLTMD